MNKQEFLEGLQHALSGEVPPEVVRENMQYYQDYIQTELQKGRSDSDVLGELGDPRLIARTIIDTTPGAGEGGYETYSGSEREGHSSAGESDRRAGGMRYYDLSKWYWKLLGVLLVVMVVVVIITVVGGLLSLVIPLLPVLGLLMIVMWFVRGPRR